MAMKVNFMLNTPFKPSETPVMRVLGISARAIQTAGYSGQSVPGIRIDGMEHTAEFREFIRPMVR